MCRRQYFLGDSADIQEPARSPVVRHLYLDSIRSYFGVCVLVTQFDRLDTCADVNFDDALRGFAERVKCSGPLVQKRGRGGD